MRILFDQGTPVPPRRHLRQHVVVTAYERGWSEFKNGDLLRAAEADGFDVLVTTDSHLKHRQTVRGRRLAIVVLLSASWPRIEANVVAVVAAIDAATPGAYVEVSA